MTQATTKQGKYLARVITAKATINPATQHELALALQRITDHHGGNQADAIRTAIALYDQMLNNPHDLSIVKRLGGCVALLWRGSVSTRQIRYPKRT